MVFKTRGINGVPQGECRARKRKEPEPGTKPRNTNNYRLLKEKPGKGTKSRCRENWKIENML